jgi:hypothetical protein
VSDQDLREVVRAIRAGGGSVPEARRILEWGARGAFLEAGDVLAVRALILGAEIDRCLALVNGKRRARIVTREKLASRVRAWVPDRWITYWVSGGDSWRDSGTHVTLTPEGPLIEMRFRVRATARPDRYETQHGIPLFGFGCDLQELLLWSKDVPVC